MTTTNLPGPITPIEVRVRPYTAPEERLRFRWQQDPAGQPYRDAAIAWLTRRLREPVYESAGIIASDTLDPVDTRARWWTVREHLGELDRLTVTEHRDLAPCRATGYTESSSASSQSAAAAPRTSWSASASPTARRTRRSPCCSSAPADDLL